MCVADVWRCEEIENIEIEKVLLVMNKYWPSVVKNLDLWKDLSCDNNLSTKYVDTVGI